MPDTDVASCAVPPKNWLVFIDDAGKRKSRAWVWITLGVACFPAFLTLLKLPSVVMTSDSAQIWIVIARTAAFASAALMFALQISLPRLIDYRKFIWRSFLPDTGRAICLAGLVYLFAGLTFLRVVPVISTYISSSPQILVQPIQSIGHSKECRRRCLVPNVLGKAGASYSVKLKDYPNLFAPIILYEKPEGFRYLDHGMRNQPDAQLTGKGNWFGLRIDYIKAHDTSQDDQAGLSTISPIG